MEIEHNDDESLGFLEEYGSEPIGDDVYSSGSAAAAAAAGTTGDSRPKHKHQHKKGMDAKEALAFATAMGTHFALRVSAAVATGYKKCSESESTRRLVLKVAELESKSSMGKKCRESELGKKLYKKVEDSELGKYAKKQAADNPQKAKKQLAVAAVVLFFMIRWLFFGDAIPPTVPIISEEGVIPNVLFVGAPQSGVEELSEWLYSNTNVCPPQILQGEFESTTKAVGYWNRPGPKNLGLPWYAKRFQHCQDARIIMDATPNYFHVAKQVYKTYHAISKRAVKHLKIVVVVREPTEREYWDYMKSGANNVRSFEAHLSDIIAPCYFGEQPTAPKATCPIGASHYSLMLKQWFDRFDRKNILILNFDELESSPKTALGRLEAFLGYAKIPRGASTLVMPDSSKTASNGKTVQASALPGCAAQHTLQTIFDDWNLDFYDLIKKTKGPKVEQNPFPEFELGMCKE